MHKQFQVVQTSSRKGLDTRQGNKDPHFLQNTRKDFWPRAMTQDFWPRACDVAKEPENFQPVEGEQSIFASLFSIPLITPERCVHQMFV